MVWDAANSYMLNIQGLSWKYLEKLSFGLTGTNKEIVW